MSTMDRRSLLRLGLGATGALLLAGGYAGYEVTRAGSLVEGRPVASGLRRLVVIEMAGGNDGLSMVVPYADPRYPALRRNTAIEPERVHPIDAAVGFHPALAELARRGAAVVAGVGTANPDLSHFEMLQRWWTGDPDGRTRPGTGFLGRLCDVIGDPAAPAVGVSLGLGPTQALACRRATTLSVDTGSAAGFPDFSEDPGVQRAWIAAQRAMAHPDRRDSALVSTARASVATALTFSDAVARLPAAAGGYPESDLGAQLELAARLLSDENIGLRIVHVPMTDDFDTHEDHLSRYQAIMADFDRCLESFRVDLQQRGLADSVLVATMSEFGRRVPDNGSSGNDSSGLDHGTASVALLIGPVNSGVFGASPSLADLDADGNLKASVNMAEFYATIAESWFGIPANEVLGGSPRPIEGIVNVLK